MNTTTEKPADEKEKSSLSWLYSVFSVVYLWLLLMAYISGGWQKLLLVLVVVVTIAGVIGMVSGMSYRARRKPLEIVAALMIFATIGWFIFTGSYHSWLNIAWDVSGITLGMTAGWMLWKLLGRFRTNLPTRITVWLDNQTDLSTIVCLFTGWIGLSLLILARTPLLPSDPARFETIGADHSIVTTQAKRWADLRIGLALSGGGYRAAVMHTGTLHALEKLGVRIGTLSTVSGGSIIGGYYAIGGDPVVFKDAVAAGRFNLKRELLLIHNAARLPFPFEVPGFDIKLFPWYDFSRGNVQANLLDRTLFDKQESWRTPNPHQPRLIIAATDLTFGLTVGLLPDGLLTITTDHDVEAYRGNSALLSHDLSFAQRVATSGAFPVAFPPMPIGAKVIPIAASGQGTRPLLLADGGVADNSGLDLLMAADAMACKEKDCAHDKLKQEHALDPSWAVDVYLASDGGAIFGVNENVKGPAALARAFDVSGAKLERHFNANKTPVNFSAQEAYLSPGQQFMMYGDDRLADNDKRWHVSFDPRKGFPDSILSEIVNLLPDSTRSTAQKALSVFEESRKTETVIDNKDWSRALTSFKSAEECNRLLDSGSLGEQVRKLPGICAAVELRIAVQNSAQQELEAFRDTSTLDDQLPAERVETLFRLGQMLVYLNWPQLESALDAALANKPSANSN